MQRFESFVLKLSLLWFIKKWNYSQKKPPNPPLCKIISESWRDKKIGEACIQIPVQRWLHGATWFRSITHKYDWQCLLLNNALNNLRIFHPQKILHPFYLRRSVTKENSQAKNGATNIWQFYFISNIAKKQWWS